MANDADIHSRLLREKVSVEFNFTFLTANHALIPDCRRKSYNPVRGRRRQSNNS